MDETPMKPLPSDDDGLTKRNKLADFEETDDPWKVAVNIQPSTPWSELSGAEKAYRVLVLWLGKLILLIAFLYFFIIALDLLGSAFKVLGGPTAGKAFRESDVMNNPFAGLMIGILATVLVQSSSTSTSITIAMTGSHILEVKQAIPIIMGANIGTSVTNTIVSLGHAKDRNEFRRAFGGATVHDMFNILSVCVFLPIEIVTGYLRRLSGAIVDSMNIPEEKAKKIEILKKLTGPLAKKIIQVDKKLITKIAEEDDPAALELLKQQSMVIQPGKEKGDFLFLDTGMSDGAVGVILLVLSLALLCVCLYGLVKLLRSVMRGSMVIWLKKALNLQLNPPLGFLSGYVLILVGAGITFLVQSSSVTTSALTPLVAVGVLELENMYPITLGANIGTTVTGILSALAGSDIAVGLQVAFCHLFFNLSGILMWYPAPPMRRVPLKLARWMGDTTADFRWFPVAYTLLMFLIVPGILFLLSMAGWVAFTVVGAPLLAAILFCVWLRLMQLHFPHRLPDRMRDFEWATLVPDVIKNSGGKSKYELLEEECQKLRKRMSALEEMVMNVATVVHGRNGAANGAEVPLAVGMPVETREETRV